MSETLIEYLDIIKDRIVVSIPKVSGLQPWIEKQTFKYIDISHSHEHKFFINTKGMWLDATSALQYATELKEASMIVKNLNHLIK